MSESLAQQSSTILKEFIRNPATRSGFNSPLGKPNKPTIVIPANASTVTNSRFTLSAYSHPLGVTQKSIQIQRSLVSDFSTLLDVYVYTDNSTTIYESPVVVGQMTLYARARYIDSFGVASDWSDSIVYTSESVNFSIINQFRVGGNTSTIPREITFTGSQAGDILVVSVACNTPDNFTPPAGWTLIHQLNNCLSGSSYALIYRIATQSNTIVSMLGGFEYVGVIIRGLTGAPTFATLQLGVGVMSSYMALATNSTSRPSLIFGYCRTGSTINPEVSWTKVFGIPSESLSGYFTPFFAWSETSVGTGITRNASTYQAYFVNLTFGS